MELITLICRYDGGDFYPVVFFRKETDPLLSATRLDNGGWRHGDENPALRGETLLTFLIRNVDRIGETHLEAAQQDDFGGFIGEMRTRIRTITDIDTLNMALGRGTEYLSHAEGVDEEDTFWGEWAICASPVPRILPWMSMEEEEEVLNA